MALPIRSSVQQPNHGRLARPMNNPYTGGQSVSVVIRTYNRARHTAIAIRSVLDQTIRPAEVIVVDDASTDETADVMEVLAHENPLIKLVRLDHNRGMAGAQEVGVGAAAGDFIAFLDSDDVWDPSHLETAVAAVATHPAAVLLYAKYGLIDVEGRVLKDVVTEPSLSPFPLEDFLFKKIVVTPSRCLVKREVIDEVGGVPPYRTGDWVLNVLVAAAHPGGVVQLPYRTAFMRMHPGQDYGRPEVITDLMGATEYIFRRLPSTYADLESRVLSINWLNSTVFSWQSGRYGSAWKCLGHALGSDLSVVSTIPFVTAFSRLLIPPALGKVIRNRKYQCRSMP